MVFILSLPFTLLHCTLTYLYPLYASYKAIAHQQTRASSPLSRSLATGEEQTELATLEAWLMYWSVLGALQIVEGWAEWTISWLPFYSVFKAIFTLWLVLPQTKGATMLYTGYLGPFLKSHESDIDLAVEKAKGKASEAAGNWITALWKQIREAVLGAAAAGSDPASSQAGLGNAGASHTPPTMHDPAGGPVSQLFGLLKQYGPLAAAGVVNAMDRATVAAGGNPSTMYAATSAEESKLKTESQPTQQRPRKASATTQKSTGTMTAADRRRAELDRQLNELGGSASTAAASAGGAAASQPARRRTASSSTRGGGAATKGKGRGGKTQPYSSPSSEGESDQFTKPALGSNLGASTGFGLSGSYQLVDEEDEESNEDDEDKEGTPVPASAAQRAAGGRNSWLPPWLSGGAGGPAVATGAAAF